MRALNNHNGRDITRNRQPSTALPPDSGDIYENRLTFFEPYFRHSCERRYSRAQGATFASLTIAGTVAAGPIGFIVGALSGAFLADQSRQANNAEMALLEAGHKQDQLQQALQQKETDVNRLQELATQRMTFQVLFASGADTLNALDMQRIKALADHLRANPDLMVKLDGHADPRGTDEYNNVLSQERAKAVKNALEGLGIAAERISYTGHGNRFSNASKGDEEAYQQERRVDITVDRHTNAFSGI